MIRSQHACLVNDLLMAKFLCDSKFMKQSQWGLEGNIWLLMTAALVLQLYPIVQENRHNKKSTLFLKIILASKPRPAALWLFSGLFHCLQIKSSYGLHWSKSFQKNLHKAPTLLAGGKSSRKFMNPLVVLRLGHLSQISSPAKRVCCTPTHAHQGIPFLSGPFTIPPHFSLKDCRSSLKQKRWCNHTSLSLKWLPKEVTPFGISSLGLTPQGLICNQGQTLQPPPIKSEGQVISLCYLECFRLLEQLQGYIMSKNCPKSPVLLDLQHEHFVQYTFLNAMKQSGKQSHWKKMAISCSILLSIHKKIFVPITHQMLVFLIFMWYKYRQLTACKQR